MKQIIELTRNTHAHRHIYPSNTSATKERRKISFFLDLVTGELIASL
jgi:hypothetical protein